MAKQQEIRWRAIVKPDGKEPGAMGVDGAKYNGVVRLKGAVAFAGGDVSALAEATARVTEIKADLAENNEVQDFTTTIGNA